MSAVSAPPDATAAPAVAPATPRPANPDQTVILLGPQVRESTLGPTLEDNGITGRIATVTAGWQEREDDVQNLSAHLDGRTLNLRLHRRADELFAADPEFAAVHRERQKKLRALQSLYSVRLDRAAEAVMLLEQRSEPEDLLEEEREAALDAVRRLDAEHLRKIRAVHEEYDENIHLEERTELRRHRVAIAKIMSRTSALAIAGGHVAVLLNRLQLFGVLEHNADKPVVGWSAGAMVLAEKVVVYHDTPPQGPGNAEVLEIGLGACRGVVALPHARSRLRLQDPRRVSRFARRFRPDRCLAMDERACLVVGPDGWSASPDTFVLTEGGGVEELGP